MRIALVGCCKPKLEAAAPARDLYRSDLFKKCRAYAELRCDAWAILSGQHGLVLPEKIIEPYDLVLNQLSWSARDVWARRVGKQLQETFPTAVRDPDSRFVFLAGETYFAFRSHVPGLHARWEQPLRVLQVGERLAWLKKEIASARA